MSTFETFEKYVIPNYTRYPVTLVRGEDSWVWDEAGKRYLDFFPGWGCNMLGHCPKYVVEAVKKQVETLIHIPNSWYSQEQGEWAKLLSERSFGGKCFFCNSGAEANEAGIKLARMYGNESKRYKIVTFFNGFHGRTMGAVAATAQPKYQQGLGPLLPGFIYAEYNNLEAVKEIVENDDEIVSIMLEPIQGEGGVNVPDREFLQGLRDLCDKKDILLHFDEVQTGCGRTGEWFAYQKFGVTPDIMTLAKTLCGGIAGAALVVRQEFAPYLRPGMHAATFGGNPIAAAAGIATIRQIEEEHLLENANRNFELFRKRFLEIGEKTDIVKDVRGCGAMVGMELSINGTEIVQKCMEKGLLINCTHGTVIRLLPAVTLTEELVNEGCDILRDVILGL
ncbi:MAG: aspartate aminotransferase family protein [Thermoguttaceae bacterium]|nr:aspartate aminotransferase family protein [Thermoguttaceae bacterium]MBP3694121.1 aspartate aminotransferase family protein [Thermoguttaceae bacterium]